MILPALDSAAEKLNKVGILTARLDAEVLLASVLHIDRSELLLTEKLQINDSERSLFEALTLRRQKGEPVARILGLKEFWSLDFELNKDTLVPRPDSETVVAEILDYVSATPAGMGHRWRILDLGTGSGCLLLSLLHEMENARGLGVDSVEGAIIQAQINALNLGLSGRAEFILADWNQPPPKNIQSQAPYDFILSNPPYINSGDLETLPVEVRDYDPVRALDGGEDGIDYLQPVLGWCDDLLVVGGLLVLEMGLGQSETVQKVARARGYDDVQVVADLSGIDRVLRCRKP